MPEIHVWSDYVCPFCLIADELIERAIGDRTDVEVVHHPHELRPYPTPTLRPEDAYLPRIWRQAVLPMAGRYEVPMRLPSISPQPYTALAFRGATYAQDQNVGHAYHRRMLTAFFREDLDIGSATVLSELAEQVGLDRTDFLAALDDESRARQHTEALAASARLDITVVPTMIIGDRRIEGVASEAVLRQALDQAVERAA
ncbi:MAG: DsbA family protein [Propionibacteriales bacterium]|nr:DsbA family protein [Propionibacteriales bacterium]